MSRPEWHTCNYCHAVIFSNEPVHGLGEPCPVKMAESIAHIELMEAQKASSLGTGLATADINEMMSDMLKKMFPGEDA